MKFNHVYGWNRYVVVMWIIIVFIKIILFLIEIHAKIINNVTRDAKLIKVYENNIL